MGREWLGYKGSKPTILILTLLTIVQGFSIIGQALGLSQTISGIFQGFSVQHSWHFLLLFIISMVIRHLCTRLQQAIAYRFAEETGTSLRQQLFKRLFELGPRHAASQGSGNLVTLGIEGIAQFRAYLELIVPRTIGMAVIPVILLGYVWLQDWVAGLILTITVPILIGFMILLGLAARKQMDKQWKSYRLLSNHFTDSLRGLETLRFLGQSRKHVETIAHVSTKYRKATMRTLRIAFLSSFALDFFTMLSVASVAVSLGLRLVDGRMSLETALVVLIVAPDYFLPIRMVGSDYHATLNGKEAGAAIQSIIDHPREEETSSSLSAPLSWTLDDPIVLSHIRVNIEAGSRSLLDDVSTVLHGARKIGIVGESGAGKSTLLDVIGGFLVPSSGSLLIHNQVLDASNRQAWQQKIAYIPQQPHLFSVSIADNIRFYEPEATEEQVEAAIRAVGLSQLVKNMPQGGKEMIGEGGRPLSGGQAQRVALARAFLGRRPILLLDEPTSHLDIETELELKTTMLNIFADRQLIIATHRLHWMAQMDLIIVMHEGKMVESGTHEQLLAHQGKYVQLLEAQAGGALV
ncbi:thiol reductant ABC exporter subunit CydD [Paenibacillus sp. N3.4]|uniref:thiol reductant ABC exporter subunit CydD n=1 Tax=Paenibacillus sp. N3.4 TaxID=2603222 RepID=UPI0011CB482D|nr:thiol reductant ABC exporter subunit CydD [Paenibacillus sp. N3.4]TXK85015.1 thiol reductant ABC exporter subunit CydD [Paenibacillus sp. N3.4]